MKKHIQIWIVTILLMGMACSSSDSDDGMNQDPTPSPTPPTSESGQIKIIYDDFQANSLVIVGSSGLGFMVAFNRVVDGNEMNFTVVQDSLPIVMKDDKGAYWDIFGKAIDGPDAGKQLSSPASFIGYWFSWGAFYPGLEIYDNTLSPPNQGESVSGSDAWSIPRDEVFVGAPKEAIPSIDNPEFVRNKTTKIGDPDNFLDDSELVVMVNINGTVHVYPHNIMNWHEIVNDEIDETKFALVFCPLTGTSTAWNRSINGVTSTYGVSGFLYNSNVVPYDRVSGSNWSQMLLKSVNGSLEGTESINITSIETNYSTAQIISNDFQQLTTDTGFNRDYTRNPYGSYPTTSSIMFPLNFEDNRLHPKERVLGVIIGENAKAYRFSSF
ncbi:DUF3179 domain-containing (seleno)protein [Ancylomarina sp. YFZ004]